MLKTFLPVALLALAAVPAAAQPIRPFSIAALKAAQAKGEPVLIDAFAPWCPTCRAQAPALDAIAASPDYAKLVILRLDYDHQIAEKKALGINQQSTLIAFKGSREVGRTLGVTQADQIKAFAATPLK
ncbi:MAG: thioredoxin family protein [Sphingomonas oligoaromativorans]|jgi:thiol-disulfide isomerase/thioredoxin